MTAADGLLPHVLRRATPIVIDGKPAVSIVYPHCDPAYRPLAEKLAEIIGHYANDRPELIEDSRLISHRGTPLQESTKRRSLILLGNLNTNRLISPLYARYYCATDGLYPGEIGYDLRTLINPFGTGVNDLLVGGSTLPGVERAIDRLIAHIDACGKPGTLILPYLLEVELAPSLAKMLADWPDARLDAPLPETADLPMYRAIGAYAIAYGWTGDERYGIYARDCLRKLNSLVGDSYGDRHYYVERLIRAIQWLAAGGFLDPNDLQRTDRLLLNMMLGQQKMWWRKRDATPPLGHRHHGKGTYEFFLTAQYLRWQASPDEATRERCDRWIWESQAYLDGLAQAGFDDQDDDTTMNNMATLFWYALGEERYAFFENGNARLAADRAIALLDNMGAAAGQSGYSESYLGMMYMQQEATIPVAASVFFFQDPHLKWILKKLPNLDVPIAGGRYLYYYPLFMHKFDTGEELPPARPDATSRLRVLPLAPYQFKLNNDPPVHIEPYGHFANAPETWQLPEGIGKNVLPYENGFDKIVLRGGFEKDDIYLLLQGYQGGFRWQGRNRAANAIVRFSQFGHIFLIQNTRRLSAYHSNGVYASNGFNLAPVPPIAEWLAADEFPQVALCATRLSDDHGSQWSRHIFWHQAGMGFFIVIDCLSPQSGDDTSYTCTWRTLGYAALDGQEWTSIQDRYLFTLHASEPVDSFTETESGQSAAAPSILRQVKYGRFVANEPVTFQNLFYVRPVDAPEYMKIKKISPTQGLVYRDETQPVGLCAVGSESAGFVAPGIQARAISAWISPAEIDFSGVRELKLEAGANWEIQCDRPLGISLDLASDRLTIWPDSPSNDPVKVMITSGEEVTSHWVKPGERYTGNLDKSACQRLAGVISHALDGLLKQTPPAETHHSTLAAPGDGWKTTNQFDGWTPVQERLRNLTVAAEPPPVDGFPEQLIDTVYPEVRDTSRQWPDADQYRITITLPEVKPISHVRLVGDSLSEPFFKLFNPLPSGIKLELSSTSAGEEWITGQTPSEAGTVAQRRYRGNEDRFESQIFPIHATARRLRLTIPSPLPGRMLALNEVEIYSADQSRPEICQMVAADLDHSGRRQIVACNENHELLVLKEDGAEHWRKQLPGPVTHLSCHDLDGNGRQAVCVSLLDGDILIYSPEGDLRQTIHLAEEMRRRGDSFFGWLDSAYDLQVWGRDENGRAALMAGGYSLVVFLSPEGKILGHSYVDGPWAERLLAFGGKAGNDIWARTGWNHGIMVYAGTPGFSPSGASVTFGNVRQPMFRSSIKVIPFVNGKSILFEACSPREAVGEKVIVAAAADGFGVLGVDRRDWLWKHEGGTPITAALVGELEDGREAVITGGADGFIAAYGLYNGQPLEKFYAGGPVTGLIWLKEAGAMAVGTRQGILALDLTWKPRSFRATDVIRMVQTGDRSIGICGKNGQILSLELL